MWWLSLAALAGPPSLTEPVRAGLTSPEDAAVVIGIEDYAFLPDVPHAWRDLDAVADLLVYTRGVPPDRVRRLRGANREQILSAVEEAREDLGDDGTLWVYFAGHGAADPATSSLLLVGDDAKPDPEVFTQRSVPVEDLASSLPERSVLILDTCWAGAARGEGALIPDSRFAVPAWAMEPPDGVTVWTASAPDEIAGAYHPARHGAFTYFVVGALRGWADGELSGEPDGKVELGEAHAWVGRALAATGTRSQTPTLIGAKAAPLTQGKLESAPSLQELPENKRAEMGMGGLVGVLAATPLERQELPAVTAFRTQGYKGPLAHVDGWQFEDGAGRSVHFQQVYDLVGGTREGDALKGRLERAQMGLGGSTLLVGVGVVPAVVAPFAFGRYLKSANKGLGCDEPDAISYVCIHEDRALAVGWGSVAASVISISSGLLLRKGPKRKLQSMVPEMVDQANERLGHR